VAERLSAAGCPVTVHEQRVSPGNVAELFSAYDIVIDATDSAASKFLLNDAAVLLDRPLVHAGVVGLEGQVLTVLPRRSACLRCLFPEVPQEGEVPSCREAGILGPVAGLLGLLQAEEALRVVRREAPRFVDRLLTVDARRGRFRTVELSRSPGCPVCGPDATVDSLEGHLSGRCEENP
jgi:adenylyltransferase/sulfurtransferase